MPHRALIERRPWLLASIALAVAWVWLRGSTLPGLYLIVLKGAPLALLAVYAVLRHRGNDTRSLAGMLGLEAVGSALWYDVPVIGLNAILIAFLIGLSLFLMHRRAVIDNGRKVAALALTLGTPLLCVFAADRAGVGVPLFLGLALGGMAASAWISTFPRSRVGLGAGLIAAGVVLEIAAAGGSAMLAMVVWPLFYIGNLVLATGVTGELRMREERF
ncbi:hypothetical protein BV97_01569 [Novosphingobium resinovorum]|uniref:Uncharacterized protein n=1 Tax=Novosphingobium resinovorum TaxID=158500 RepID=A0A031K370_9SPHN|nr:hypothetical protein [Novosphingobium resinovorum]EZP83458.1 hypothetical protein BV97_01569 [Novosphingobium resinovorum]